MDVGLDFRGKAELTNSLLEAEGAVVIVVLCSCPTASTLMIELVYHEAALLCIVGPSKGEVTSTNITLCSSIWRSSGLCMAVLLETIFAP